MLRFAKSYSFNGVCYNDNIITLEKSASGQRLLWKQWPSLRLDCCRGQAEENIFRPLYHATQSVSKKEHQHWSSIHIWTFFDLGQFSLDLKISTTCFQNDHPESQDFSLWHIRDTICILKLQIVIWIWYPGLDHLQHQKRVYFWFMFTNGFTVLFFLFILKSTTHFHKNGWATGIYTMLTFDNRINNKIFVKIYFITKSQINLIWKIYILALTPE